MKSPSEKAVEIIQWAMDEKGMKQIEIEDKSGITRGTIGKWRLTGSQNITANNLGKLLLLFPQINADWVMRDVGDMLNIESRLNRRVTDNSLPISDFDPEYIKSLIDENKELKKKLENAQKAITAMLS